MDYKEHGAAVSKIIGKLEKWNQEFLDAFLPEDQTKALRKMVKWSERLVVLNKSYCPCSPPTNTREHMF